MNRDDIRYKYLTRLGTVLTDTDGLLLLMLPNTVTDIGR
jgi:hypothetical protein